MHHENTLEDLANSYRVSEATRLIQAILDAARVAAGGLFQIHATWRFSKVSDPIEN